MISKRLKTIAGFIDKNDKVVDVGCDHSLLGIYLYQNKLCKTIIASDINENALANAIKNINEAKLPIKTYVSDGIKNIPKTMFDTIVISGMGTNTILNILEDANKYKHVNKIILQSNNDHFLLRKEMNNKGFYLEDEVVIKDGKKYYITMLFLRISKTNTKDELLYGLNKADKKNYYKELISTKRNILSKIPRRKVFLRLRNLIEINKLKKRIK